MTTHSIARHPAGPDQPSDTYIAGWVDGITDALPDALARAQWTSTLTEDWARGYTDAVHDRQTATADIAWQIRTTQTGAQS